MPIGDPGKEQFRRAIITLRNLHIVAGVGPLMTLRSELIGNDEFQVRGGFDTPTRDHMIGLLVYCDRMRRRITHNPDELDLGEKIEDAIEVLPEDFALPQIQDAEDPYGGDDIQNSSGGLIDLPYALDGSDSNIPLNSSLNLRNDQALLLLGAVDRAVVHWTRLESRHRTRFITRFDSMRVYGGYQEILGFLQAFGGDENRVDIAQGVLPSEEPLGPTDSPNFKEASSGASRS